MKTLKLSTVDVIALVPGIALLAYASYKLALEVWCVAYGLIY